MILFTAQESSALPTLAETQAVAAEVHEDLQQLKPNAILESIKSWTPGLLSLAYRLFVAALIIFIGSRIALYISYYRTFRFCNIGHRPVTSGKPCKLRRRHPDPCYAAFWYP